MNNLIRSDAQERAWEQFRQLLLADLKRVNPDHRRAEQQWREAESARERIEQRLRDLDNRYADPCFAWRADDQKLERYARDHHNSLRAHQQEITTAYEQFHADRSFIDYLREHRPDLYARADPVFHYRALALSEQPPMTEERPRLTPEERQARIERFRQRMLTRQRVQAEDQMAKLAQRLALRSQIRAMLNETDELDEDEKEQLLREFEDTIENPEDDINEKYKQL